MLVRLHYVLVTIVCLAGQSLARTEAQEEQEKSCYTNNSNAYELFATKTSYFEVDNEEVKPFEVPGKLHIIIS